MVFGALGAGQPTFIDSIGQYMTAMNAFAGASENIAIDGVKLPHLFPGTKLTTKPMGTPGGVGTDFENSLLRHIAAPLGLSYEQFSKDYSQTNYSSARASMGETRKKNVADRLATNIFALILEEDLNAGLVPLPKGRTAADFYTDPVFREALLNCTWIGASRGQIDEMKETQAAVMRINSGLSTYEIESARLGIDFRQLFRQRAREQKMIEKLGLVFGQAGDATQPGANDAQKTVTKSGKNDDTQD
jgi:lambda family phage portal protein